MRFTPERPVLSGGRGSARAVRRGHGAQSERHPASPTGSQQPRDEPRSSCSARTSPGARPVARGPFRPPRPPPCAPRARNASQPVSGLWAPHPAPRTALTPRHSPQMRAHRGAHAQGPDRVGGPSSGTLGFRRHCPVCGVCGLRCELRKQALPLQNSYDHGFPARPREEPHRPNQQRSHIGLLGRAPQG